MTICSLVVQTAPENVNQLSGDLEKIKGVEVHASNKAGKLIVSIDHPDRTHCSETIMTMSTMDGVLSSSLVFEYQEDHEETATDGENL